MNVEEFVSESLKQIAKGLVSAQKTGVELTQLGSQHDIKFDIAVTVSDISEKGGKAGLTVWSIGAEAKTKKQLTSNTVSRIQFVVQMYYPEKNKTID